MTFAILDRKTLKLTNAKGRKEMHGEEHVQAIDLRFSGAFGNEVLSLFHAALPAALFTIEGPSASDDMQQEMRLPVSDLDVLRFTKLRYPLKWEGDITGATLAIFWGAGKPIVLSLCKVTDFAFEPINGGAVTIYFRVSSAADITEKILGRTGIMMGDDVEITLEPSVVAQEAPKQEMQTPVSIFISTDGADGGDQTATATVGEDGTWPFGGDGPAEP